MLKLPAQVTSISTKVDGSIKITTETRELDPNSASELFTYRNSEIWMLLDKGEDALIASAVPTEKPDPMLNTKTPSQRLRAVLFVYWQQNGSQGDFDTFYKSMLEKVIEQFKDRLE